MNKRLISRLMRERIDGLHNSGVYFFGGNFDYVLRGVVLEYVPRGGYIWEFRFPLFDFFGPGLNYSDRLAGGAFVGKGEMSEVDLVDYVLTSPEGRNAFSESTPTTLLDFVHYLLTSGALLNPHVQLVHAAALGLLDQESQALDILDEILPALHPNDVPSWKRLREDIRQGPGIARGFLNDVREKNLRTLREIGD